MCGNFRVNANNREIAALIGMLPAGSPPPGTGDVFPGDAALVLFTQNDQICPATMFWGFPGKGAKSLIFNARAETARSKPFFSRATRERRLVVPAGGFYEWRAVEGQKRKEKFYFQEAGQELVYLAGIWTMFHEPGLCVPHFTILTTAANESMRPYHHRMPVTVHENEIEPWIKGEKYGEIMERVPFALMATPVAAGGA